MAKRKNPRALKSHAKKPGRKPKLSVGESARANNEAPAEYRNRIGIITELDPAERIIGSSSKMAKDRPPGI